MASAATKRCWPISAITTTWPVIIRRICCATSLAATAYLLDHDPKYRDWLVEYVDAWVERMKANNDIIPSNIGLDGKIGGACDGKWYGGVYGWAFSVITPQTGEVAHRNTHQLGLPGFGNATLLTGNMKYADAWCRQIDAVNVAGKDHRRRDAIPAHVRRGRLVRLHACEVRAWHAGHCLLVDERRRCRAAVGRRLAGISGRPDPDYPAKALRGELDALRIRVAAIHADETTPDTRLADDPLPYSPALTAAPGEPDTRRALPGHNASLLHARFRYFDPATGRPGLPENVAALVETLAAEEATLRLVNLDVLHPRTVVVQGGAYGEHQIVGATIDGQAGRHRSTAFCRATGPGLRRSTGRQDASIREPPDACPALGGRALRRLAKIFRVRQPLLNRCSSNGLRAEAYRATPERHAPRRDFNLQSDVCAFVSLIHGC